MPIYMDVHTVPGVKARNVAEAHREDLFHQHEFGCNCITYWIDEGRETVFCLIEAPEKEAVIEMHNKAHGLVPHKIIEVDSNIVESFLGRIYDPEEAVVEDNGLKVFHDSSFRILVVTKISDPVLLKHQLGTKPATAIIEEHNTVIRKNLSFYGGSEVEHPGSGFIISFTSASKAVACALAILKQLAPGHTEALGLKIGIHSGEPIEESNQLFGDTISFAEYMCTISRELKLALSSSVKELVSNDHWHDQEQLFFTLSPQDEALLKALFKKLEDSWQDPDFDIENYCSGMAMSKSQLYRKTIALTGMSPNHLLKEYRLSKAKQLMKKQFYNIAQVTFDAGFTSPSYFTKCFKKNMACFR